MAIICSGGQLKVFQVGRYGHGLPGLGLAFGDHDPSCAGKDLVQAAQLPRASARVQVERVRAEPDQRVARVQIDADDVRQLERGRE